MILSYAFLEIKQVLYKTFSVKFFVFEINIRYALNGPPCIDSTVKVVNNR